MTRYIIKIFFIVIFCSAFVVFPVVAPVYADIYVCIDSEGVLHFTNVPTSSNYKIYITI